MSVIEDLERKEQSLRDQLAAVSKSLKAAKEAAFEVQVGEYVRLLPSGELAVVAEIERPEYRWIRVFKKRKDGTFGKKSKFMPDRSWEKLSSPASSNSINASSGDDARKG